MSGARFQTDTTLRRPLIGLQESRPGAPRVVRVVYFGRKSHRGYGSVETVFRVVRAALPHDIAFVERQPRFASRGLFRRAFTVVEAALRQGEVNHITGDVHFLALLMRRRRTMITVLDLVGLTRGSWLRRKLIEWIWYRLPAKRASIITTISDSTRNDLLKVLGPDAPEIHTIPCCISPTFVASAKPFSADRPTVLVVGTGPNKNLPRIAEALAGLSCRVLIVGPLSDVQRAMLARHRIDYSDRRDLSETEMLETYAESDILAFPSTYEGFGMPILEAQAVGRPVVTSTVSSMPEVAGDGACLVDPFDSSSIRQGILRIIHDKDYRASLVAAGARNCSRFQSRAIAAAYAALYRDISERNRRASIRDDIAN